MTATKPTISAFGKVPEFAKGRVRDLRIRWALEEMGEPYETHLLDAYHPRGPEYVAWQPFDQVPAMRDGDIEIFESGAILLYLAEKHDKLLPSASQDRWQAIAWLFAALNSVEPALNQITTAAVFHGEAEWSDGAVAAMKPFAQKRLERVADALGDKDWLAGEFSIADILMASLFLNDVLELANEQPALKAYRARAFERPAFQRARAAQMADFTDSEED